VEYDIEAAIAAGILALATLPARAEIAADRFRKAQLRAAEETLRAAAEARRNYYRAVAAKELAGFLTQAMSRRPIAVFAVFTVICANVRIFVTHDKAVYDRRFLRFSPLRSV
jgi:hypothetical protein